MPLELSPKSRILLDMLPDFAALQNQELRGNFDVGLFFRLE